MGQTVSIEEIRKSAESEKLIVIFGAGSSISLTAKSKQAYSWPDLVKNALNYGKNRSLLSEAQCNRYIEALASEDLDELLGAAEFASRKLNAPSGINYAHWMRETFENIQPENGGMLNSIRAVAAQKIPIATLNYDTLLEKALGYPSIDFSNTAQVMEWSRREKNGILHLHGVWSNPKSCIFGIRDYHDISNNEIRDLIQRNLGTMNRLLFVGCGDTFADPNFSALISWLKLNLGADTPRHYALVKEADMKSKFADINWQGFVDPLSFGGEFSDLPGFLLNCFPTKDSPKASKTRENLNSISSSLCITAYRNHLLRDCGEMTIEGMRADLDMAQRKFDLEKLFVPLEVIAYPPVLATNDPQREVKLQQWQRGKDALPQDFASAFTNHNRIALLALPGGGKTLLLKRLAVAYSSSARLETSNDNLPTLDLIPIMIRCREWKDHIRKPFTTLLDSISTITGDNNLKDLSKSLSKHLKAGNVLLLVDGLDEIHDDGDRSIFVDNLEKFLNDNPKIRLVVTSREAGFDLVAPSISRFCKRYRIAPLNSNTIKLLSSHWHNLMVGQSPQSTEEASSVANTLLSSVSLHRLAENPLLLTMLLVVKHSAGRLPPDRVSLYDRAVEVLLDTWNIKGHDALNTKESVPQLSCLAFELLQQGKQTATESEILEILNEAREKLPMIGRWAKDSPHDFLKRVELRSSLILEGGHTLENGKTVPFYQFRHLTFQEFLAAKACVEGFTIDPSQRNSPLDALKENLVTDEWKEVVPMTAVLSQMKAGPILSELVKIAQKEVQSAKKKTLKLEDWSANIQMPPASGRLAQAMSEEAFFPQDALPLAIDAIITFANGCLTNDNWSALCRGPYAEDLREDALNKFLSNPTNRHFLIRNTVALLEARSEQPEFWQCETSLDIIMSRLECDDLRVLCRVILSVAGCFWINREHSPFAQSDKVYRRIETLLFDTRPALRIAAKWVWGFWRLLNTDKKLPTPDSYILKELIADYLNGQDDSTDLSSFALSFAINSVRDSVDLNITSSQLKKLRHNLQQGMSQRVDLNRISFLRFAYTVKNFANDNELRNFISRVNMDEDEIEKSSDIFISLEILKTTKRKNKNI